MSDPTFLCDDMFQGLARWLRAAGYDAACSPGVPDGELADEVEQIAHRVWEPFGWLVVDKGHDYQAYSSRKEATATAAAMRGWIARPAQLLLPNDPLADEDGAVWVIECRSPGADEGSDPLYMRDDGYVR